MPTNKKGYWSQWYRGLDPEEKKDYNFKRAEVRRIKKERGWLKEPSPEIRQAYSHQHAVKRRYPKVYEKSTITTPILVSWIKETRGKECPYCGSFAFHIDHIVPLSRGGPHELTNVQMTCKDCNIAKGSQTEQEFLNHIKKIYNKVCSIQV